LYVNPAGFTTASSAWPALRIAPGFYQHIGDSRAGQALNIVILYSIICAPREGVAQRGQPLDRPSTIISTGFSAGRPGIKKRRLCRNL